MVAPKIFGVTLVKFVFDSRSPNRVIQSEYVDAQWHLFDIQRISIDILQDIRRGSWISVDHHGHPSMFLDIHANAWIFHK